jgi:UDP-N-acetylglucosamine pyrophosphorylase
MTNNKFIQTITSTDPDHRNRSFQSLCGNIEGKDLIDQFDELDLFRKNTSNLYERVRACIFLYSGHRFFLQESSEVKNTGIIDTSAFENLLNRNYEKAIDIIKSAAADNGYNSVDFSFLAECYHKLTFEILADQVRKSVRANRGNLWMFRVGHPDQHPLQINPVLMKREGNYLFPILREKTSVRMDLTHSCWSDIFFLGMDYPEGARVINVSVDIGVYGRDKDIKPPIETYLRVIPEPVIRLTSLDLKSFKDISDLEDLFNFGNDYLSLLKGAIIASGFIPLSFEGTSHKLSSILSKVIAPGHGIELVTKVNDIPKGSRLAVSTNLLASMISLLMRATSQTDSLEGTLSESDRRIIASRAILGEWLGGSGGGWQDSGGIWPGIKAIEGKLTKENDPEFGVSRGCLLPRHRLLEKEIHPEFEKRLTSSLILMHGGMTSNVGPILEMVTEKYLLRSDSEWRARQNANLIYNEILGCLKTGDIKKLAHLTSENFDGPIKTIIPATTNFFTEKLISSAKEMFGEDYWGFLMLGGISGGGMGMFVNPEIYETAKDKLLTLLLKTKNEISEAVPFAIEPVVYNFIINKKGSVAGLLTNSNALMPYSYYSLMIPVLTKVDPDKLQEIRKIEIDLAASKSDKNSEAYPLLRSITGTLFRHSFKMESQEKIKNDLETEAIKKENGFDQIQHEQIRQDLIKGRIGLSRNRLPAESVIEDVNENDIKFFEKLNDNDSKGSKSISNEEVAIFALAAGVGSRWTKGAGVIKAINPFISLSGRHRSFLEIHLAKNKKSGKEYGTKIPFVIATSHLTHQPIEKKLNLFSNFGYNGKIFLSPGRSIGQRFIPMERDLRFLWEEMPQELFDENKQKVILSLRETLIGWAKQKGEGRDYIENIPFQRLSPLGHWYEFPNTLRNGTLKKLISDFPQVENILLHNIDTLGVNLSTEILNYHIDSGNALTFEVIPKRIEDTGGGLAKVNSKVRLLEGLAQPDDNCELGLSYYNSNSCWINIDKFLKLFGINRDDLFNRTTLEIDEAIRNVARRLPTYVTIKEVKYRWGFGQEDIYPVAQIEKLWGDMTSLEDIQSGFVVVPRLRGQQLKDQAQIDSWLIDGSREYVGSICEF